jgi:hypothetical protein
MLQQWKGTNSSDKFTGTLSAGALKCDSNGRGQTFVRIQMKPDRLSLGRRNNNHKWQFSLLQKSI